MTESLTSFASGTPDRPHDDVDISSKAFWSATADERERSFAVLRERGTITWHPPFSDQLLEVPDDHGFWAVTTYDDLVEVTKRHEDFLSGPGILMENLPPELVEAGQSIIGMDPPRHTKLRRLVAAAFTPKQMRRIEDRIRANAVMVVDNLLAKLDEGGGTTDFVAECAELLPMHNINDIMGVPDGDRQRAAHEAKVGTGWNDPELVGEGREQVLGRLFQALTYVHGLAASLAAQRREEPTDDLITALARAEVDGERLTDEEIGAFFVLLTIAGNDTTRQSTSHGLRALTTHPDQRAWLMEDLEGRMGSAVEELVRWATPIMTFRRTAARDLEFRGQRVTAGDKLVMFYSSANRDASRIERPHELDLSRHPNPHISFGGGGVHHCLGNQLARFQLRALFTELLTRAPHITAGEPELMPGNFFHVVKRMSCSA
ncbi:cytochrome P450 [Actinomycetospora cinnamomea]|uniref:Cytochrome P450 n=1 Tax=Actinomycetospora cinnamomea TaxID=663609 RepID=A0A2U1F425_9PSEU|nr:cytochrome P450 [Actinomycetospora cinnamomea]PVZ06935.1 cytochrome P450 [Actinomycetospora cinnamomea]